MTRIRVYPPILLHFISMTYGKTNPHLNKSPGTASGILDVRSLPR